MRQDHNPDLFMIYASSVAQVCRDDTSHRRVLRQPPFLFPLHRLDFVLRNTLAMFVNKTDVVLSTSGPSIYGLEKPLRA